MTLPAALTQPHEPAGQGRGPAARPARARGDGPHDRRRAARAAAGPRRRRRGRGGVRLRRARPIRRGARGGRPAGGDDRVHARVSEAVIGKLAFGDRSDGVVAIVRSAVDVARGADRGLPDDPLVVVVEGVEKPGNLGAILRTADGAGADAVIAADAADRPLQPERDPGEPRHDLRAAGRRPGRRRRSLDWL